MAIKIENTKETLNDISDLKLNAEKTIFLSPHPDDETLGCGGLIIDLINLSFEVEIISVTNGEAAYQDISNLSQIRMSELNNAAKAFGLDDGNIVRLNLRDGKIQDDSAFLEEKLLHFLTPNCNLFAPWKNDYHPDHEATGKIATKLANYSNVNLYYYFIWTWHHGISELNKLNTKKHLLKDETSERKIKAIKCYQSQLNHPSGNPILPDSLLTPFKQTFELFLPYEN